MQYNIKNILQSGEKVAVHVPTEDEAREVVKILIDNGQSINPLGRDGTSGIEHWYRYGKDTCIRSITNYSHINYYRSEGYTIIPASLFIQHNTPKAEKKPFAVKADSFELYERFVKECEGMGWKENKIQNRGVYTFDCDILENDRHVWFFGHKLLWNVCDSDVLTDGSIVYILETQYPEAIVAAKAWFEGEEAKAAEDKYKDQYETMSKEAERLQLLLTTTKTELSELRKQNALLLKHNKEQHDRNNAKLMAVSILLSSSMAPDNFAVDCIKQHIDELIEKEYDEPGALPF